MQFSTSFPLGAGGKNTTLCPDGDLRCVQGLVDLATWNLSIFAGRGGRPRHILIIQHCFFYTFNGRCYIRCSTDLGGDWQH